MKTVLIIDDKEEIRSVVRSTLNQFGFQTREARNGQEGIQMAMTYRPDLIICDVNMSVMDGFSTLVLIRETPELATTPFILMTGSVGREGFRRGMACGADDYLSKPFQPEELIESVVSRLVRHAEMQSQLEKRAQAARAEMMNELSLQLAAPINGILGVVSTMIRDYPALKPEAVLANACQINESLARLGELTGTPAHC